jgi:hypothetical protein
LRTGHKRDVEDTYKAKQQQRQAEFDQALEKRKAELSKELEGWKAGYQKALDENRIRFSKLHEDRAAAIKDLFRYLVVAEEALGAFTNPLKYAGQNEDHMREEARKTFNEFALFFTHNRILFTEANCQLIEKIRDTAKNAYFDFTEYDDIASTLTPATIAAAPPSDTILDERRKKQREAYKSMTGEFRTLRKRLEREFRAAMGMVETPDAKDAK